MTLVSEEIATIVGKESADSMKKLPSILMESFFNDPPACKILYLMEVFGDNGLNVSDIGKLLGKVNDKTIINKIEKLKEKGFLRFEKTPHPLPALKIIEKKMSKDDLVPQIESIEEGRPHVGKRFFPADFFGLFIETVESNMYIAPMDEGKEKLEIFPGETRDAAQNIIRQFEKKLGVPKDISEDFKKNFKEKYLAFKEKAKKNKIGVANYLRQPQTSFTYTEDVFLELLKDIKREVFITRGGRKKYSINDMMALIWLLNVLRNLGKSPGAFGRDFGFDYLALMRLYGIKLH